jgi:hypothetical protein
MSATVCDPCAQLLVGTGPKPIASLRPSVLAEAVKKAAKTTKKFAKKFAKKKTSKKTKTKR